MTHNNAYMNDLGPPPPDHESITVGEGCQLRVEYVGNIDIAFHGYTDERLTLVDVSYVLGHGFNLYPLHAVQRTHLIISNVSGTLIIGAGLNFPHSNSRSSARATGLVARSIGRRSRKNSVFANKLLRHLCHPVPPPPRANSSSLSHYMSSFSSISTVASV